MSAKHTPGPFSVYPDQTGVELFAADGKPVMAMSRGAAELAANASLFAAAPDLLEVLSKFEVAMRGPKSPLRLRALEALAGKARAAIAKATSEAA